jgi:methylmalonyl-CoA mutase N-terminal domain/subunit
MTNRIEREASAMLDRIDALGGPLAAIESGYIQREIHLSAYAAQQAIDAGESVVVGVNRFTDTAPPAAPVFRIDPEVERRQIARVRALRASRSEAACRAAVDHVGRAARDGRNLVPPVIEAVEAKATVGEIADALREVFGEYRGQG